MARYSIVIVVVFFGPLPVWLPAFLLSCRRNPDVRWLIYTDVRQTFAVPQNVEFRYMELDDFNRRASHALRIPVDVRHSFIAKVNDLKPAFGLIFADELRPFEFWAYSDLDIVWGDIRRFVTDRILRGHDIVSSRVHKVAGHFTLFRNTDSINHTFEFIPDHRQAMSVPEHLRLDERVMTDSLRARVDGASPRGFPRVFWQQEWTMSAAYQRALGDGPEDGLWWRDGRTFRADGGELMYLHFNKLKKRMREINFGFDDTPDAFVINRRGVFA